MRRSFKRYVEKAWHVVEPATPFVDNWHIGLIVEYLEAATRGEIRNLIINIPPRCMKSLLVSVFWPTWDWTFEPSSRWLFASHSENLAIRDAVKSRRLLRSFWYQKHFGTVFRLSKDQTLKSRYENDKTGFRFSIGVGGGATGEGGDFIVVDDPHKVQEIDSEAARAAVNTWWDETMSTRANNAKTCRKVIIMQRLHQDDLTGHILEKMQEDGAEQFELLCLPMRYEPHRFVSSIGLTDPRKTPDELLWPTRFGPKEVRAIEANLAESGTAGQLQQRPAPEGGLTFKRDWWPAGNRYLPNHTEFAGKKIIGRWISFDTAMKDLRTHDFTGMAVGELLADYRLLTREVSQKKLQFPQLAKEIEDQSHRWNFDGKLRGVIIEDRSSGISVLQTLFQASPPEVAELLFAYNPGMVSKPGRGKQASLWCERGCVLLPIPDTSIEWDLFGFEEELFNFPAVKHDDRSDAFIQLILYLENLLAEGWRFRTYAAQKGSESEDNIAKHSDTNQRR